jgi:hypothetical protein
MERRVTPAFTSWLPDAVILSAGVAEQMKVLDLEHILQQGISSQDNASRLALELHLWQAISKFSQASRCWVWHIPYPYWVQVFPSNLFVKWA